MSTAVTFAFLALAPFVQGPHHKLAPGVRPGPETEVPIPVRSETKLSNATPGFGDTLDRDDWFGSAACSVGDLDGDGVPELAVGAPGDDDSAPFPGGAVWVLFLDPDGTARARTKVSPTSGGMQGALGDFESFGLSLAALGDLDGDGRPEIAAGAPGDDDGATSAGALWILTLAADGTVVEHSKISATAGGFGGALEFADNFGISVAPLGDIDGDGIGDLAVGATGDDDGVTPGSGASRGAVWILFLNADRSVRAHAKISSTEGGFTGPLADFEFFGSAVASPGDLDGDGRPELAVSAPRHAAGGPGRGGVWILFLEADGSVRAEQRIGSGLAGFTGALSDFDGFGQSLAPLGDVNGDGLGDLVVGAWGDDDNGLERGAAWQLYLAPDGSVLGHAKISDTQGGFVGDLSNNDLLGTSVARAGDVDGDGIADLVLGARQDDDGGDDHGAAWVLLMNADETVRVTQKLSDGQGGMLGTLDETDTFGSATADIGDLDGDGIRDLAVGAPGDDEAANDPFASFGAIWILFLDADGGVREFTKIGRNLGGFGTGIDDRDWFAESLVCVGDLDGDGVVDLAAGAPGDDDGTGGAINEHGAVWILFLNSDGTVRARQKISATQGGLGWSPSFGASIGRSMAPLGDFDGDGLQDLVVGSPGQQLPGSPGGAIYVITLNANGTVKVAQRISATEGGFTGHLDSGEFFAHGVAALGDVDGDGVTDVAVGAPQDSDGGGAVWILFLTADGTVKAHQKINRLEGGYSGVIEFSESFGSSLTRVDDLDADGVDELGVESFEDDGQWGGVWNLLYMNRDGTVKAAGKVKHARGGFGGELENGDGFGQAGIALGDLDDDGLPEVAVGAPGDDDGAFDHGAVWTLSLDGDYRAGFERERDLRTVLVDGLALEGTTGFQPLFTPTSAGANLGLALFDSTPGGPNDPGTRPDLLVGRGNLLVVQDDLAPAQSVSGVFDDPRPDPDGGRLRFFFDFPRSVLRLDLVDIDAATSASVSVVDRAGRSRVWTVPAGWTGDRIADGTSGVRTLDLTTLDPQPGFASTAHLTLNSAGFDEHDVERLFVLLHGPGAVDAIVIDPHPE